MKITNGVSHECWKNLFNSEKTVSMEIIFHEFFWTTFLSVGVQRNDDRKKKYFLEKACFHCNLFSLKFFDWFAMFHQWVYIRMVIKIKKNSEEKTYTEYFFQKRAVINIVISGSTECQYWKTRNSSPSNFFGYRGLFSGKWLFEYSVNFIKEVFQE